MKPKRILYRRTFDWFSVVYPIVPIGFVFWVLTAYDLQPWKQPVFWFLVAMIAFGQGLYLVVSSRSPVQLTLEDSVLAIEWPKSDRVTRIPQLEVKIRNSYLFTGGYKVMYPGDSVLVFPRGSAGQELIKALKNAQTNHRSPSKGGQG